MKLVRFNIKKGGEMKRRNFMFALAGLSLLPGFPKIGRAENNSDCSENQCIDMCKEEIHKEVYNEIYKENQTVNPGGLKYIGVVNHHPSDVIVDFWEDNLEDTVTRNQLTTGKRILFKIPKGTNVKIYLAEASSDSRDSFDFKIENPNEVSRTIGVFNSNKKDFQIGECILSQ